eukprot:8657882-Ditylum_brightwellii.AAC.1
MSPPDMAAARYLWSHDSLSIIDSSRWALDGVLVMIVHELCHQDEVGKFMEGIISSGCSAASCGITQLYLNRAIQFAH